MDRKGFLFTVTIFLILTYILLSVSVWVKSIEASERSFSEFYKESTVELTIEQITPAKLDNVSKIIMTRSLSRLDDHSIGAAVKPGPPEDENRNIRLALFDLLVNGSAPATYFKGGNITMEPNSSLTAWANNLNASLRAIGVYVSDFEVSNFSAGQSDINLVNYSFDVKLELKDYTNTSAVSRIYHIVNSIDVTGLVDPALARATNEKAGDNKTVYRQFFFNKDLYSDHSNISVSRLSQSVTGGQGWLYGSLAMASGSGENIPQWYDVAPSERSSYILVGTFSQITALDVQDYEQFGGYIVTTDATHPSNCTSHQNEANTFNPLLYSGLNCTLSIDDSQGYSTDKPYIIAPNFNASRAPVCPTLDGTKAKRRCVLMLNSHLPVEISGPSGNPANKLTTTGAGLFNVEIVRDFVMCGYYTHNPNAPSYMQRLLNDSYSRNDTTYGIETFVIGNYADDYSIYDMRSRLDRELFSNVTAYKIRGLPGCRYFESCADSPITGIFAATGSTISDYGLNFSSCNNGAAGCG